MSEGSVTASRQRWRSWLILAGVAIGMVLMTVVTLWFYLRSDGDVRSFEAEMAALGMATPSTERSQNTWSDPARISRANRIDVMVREFESSAGNYDLRLGNNPSLKFYAIHEWIPTQQVRDIAQAIVELGNEPVLQRWGGSRLDSRLWLTFLKKRILVADADELDACLAACRVLIEMRLHDRYPYWLWQDLRELCLAMVYRLPDQREHVRSMAVWLETIADQMEQEFPDGVKKNLMADLKNIRSGETIFKERGLVLPGWMQVDFGILINLELVMRAERSYILHAQLDWYQFLVAHPQQLSVWMAEAKRRTVVINKRHGWFGQVTTRQILFTQSEYTIGRLVDSVLYVRVLAAELTGTAMPVDALDPTAMPLRILERDGRKVGFYSVGVDGLDRGGDPSRDICFPLRRPGPAVP